MLFLPQPSSKISKEKEEGIPGKPSGISETYFLKGPFVKPDFLLTAQPQQTACYNQHIVTKKTKAVRQKLAFSHT
jgi:hypothetical protein